MTLALEPKNPDAGSPEFPNGFWPALCVETPVAKILECEYIDPDTKIRIRYEHDGYVGAWIDEATAKEMHQALQAYVQTDDYRNHPYFSDRSNQMDAIMEFLPVCGGFRMV